MKLKVLKSFFVLGLASFTGGMILILYFNKFYGTGLICLGAMWAMISFGQIQLFKRSKSATK